MLYYLAIITLVFLLLNLYLHDMDYMFPSCIFSAFFLLSEIVCILCIDTYEIVFHIETALIVVAGLVVFTVVGMIPRKTAPVCSGQSNFKVKRIDINNIWVILLIILYIITLFSFYQYLSRIAELYNLNYHYNGYVYSLGDKIELYDTLTKFWKETFSLLSVPIPMVYRIGNPICYACSFVMLYILVNNYVSDNEINPLHVIVILLLFAHILINGSRSPIFRVITMAVILYYILSSANKKNDANYIRDKRSKNVFFKLMMLLGVLIVICFVGLLVVMGRFDAESFNLGEYLFIYMGAPLVNLDNYIASHIIVPHMELFGAQTFSNFYNYIAKITGISSLQVGSVVGFAFSNNGIEIGNVYTTFFQMIYDFGYLGVIPLTSIIALYYCRTYQDLTQNTNKGRVINLKLLFYGYLFNDLIMLIFSNRFFGTIGEGVFIKLVIVIVFVVSILLENDISFGRIKVSKISLNDLFRLSGDGHVIIKTTKFGG